MGYFVDFISLLKDHWEQVLATPMFYILFAVLVIALTLSGERLFKKGLAQLREKNIWKKEYCQKRDENNELKRRNNELTEKIKKLQADNKEQGNRLRELTCERLKSLRKIEQQEGRIEELETEKAMIVKYLQSYKNL